MWEVEFDKWEQKWTVAEYTRAEQGFVFLVDAEKHASAKNGGMVAFHGAYDAEDADTVWPGGLVSYGTSGG